MTNRRTLPALLVSVLCLLGAARAGADQCEVVTTDVARWAQKILTAGVVISYCEPCDASSPSAPAPVKKVEARRWSGDRTQWTVAVNGKDVDLAYTFVQTGPAVYTNVALLTGCPASGVLTFLGPNGQAMGKPVEQAPEDPLAEGGNPCGGPPSPPPPPPPPMKRAVWAKIGIPECDRYFSKYLACIQDHFPEQSRAQVVKAILDTRESLKTAAASPEGQSALANACVQMDSSTKDAVAAFGCKW